MKLTSPLLSDTLLGIASAVFSIVAVVAFVLAMASILTGCTHLADYERTYSLQASDGKRSVAAGLTVKPTRPYSPSPSSSYNY